MGDETPRIPDTPRNRSSTARVPLRPSPLTQHARTINYSCPTRPSPYTRTPSLTSSTVPPRLTDSTSPSTVPPRISPTVPRLVDSSPSTVTRAPSLTSPTTVSPRVSPSTVSRTPSLTSPSIVSPRSVASPSSSPRIRNLLHDPPIFKSPHPPHSTTRVLPSPSNHVAPAPIYYVSQPSPMPTPNSDSYASFFDHDFLYHPYDVQPSDSPIVSSFTLPSTDSISSTMYRSHVVVPSSIVNIRSIATDNPLPILSRANPSRHIDELVSELARSVSTKMRSTRIDPPPRFDHCQKTKALIQHMSIMLSPDNPVSPLHLTQPEKVSLIAFLTGFHTRTVSRILTEHDTDLDVPLPWCPPCSPPKPTPTAESRREKNLSIFCEETRFQLRFFVHDLFREQKKPTLDVLCKAKDDWLMGEDTGKTVSHATMHKVLTAMGFSYRKLTTRVHSLTSPSISSMRNYYLKTMRDLRLQTGPNAPYICYLDETWVYPGMRHAFCWVDSFAEENPFLAMKIGLTPGMDPAYTKGERLVLVGVFSEEGFIHRKVYRTGKKEGEACTDYHGEMNADVFEAYAENAFAEIATRAKAKNQQPLLVMDNASYHSRYLEKIPSKSKCKWQMVEFLERNNISFNKKYKKNELYEKVISKLDPSIYNVWAVEEIAKKHGVRIVRLPPYHCIYSAIEFAWAWLKHKVKDQVLTKDNGAVAKAKVEAIFDSFPVELAPKYLRHVREKEEDHVAKGSLTFDHSDIDTHAYIRAQMRADVSLDSHPVTLDGEVDEEEEEDQPLLDEDATPLYDSDWSEEF